MQATLPTAPPIEPPKPSYAILRGLAWFLLAPLTTLLVLVGLLYWNLSNYRTQYAGRIYTGVSVLGVDLSGLTPTEGMARLTTAIQAAQNRSLTLIDPITQATWSKTLAELGVSYDVESAVEAAFQVGRQSAWESQVRDQWQSWYYGRTIAPRITIDENAFNRVVEEVATTIDQSPVDAALEVQGSDIGYTSGQSGRLLDKADLFQRLSQQVANLQTGQVTLSVQPLAPRVIDTNASAAEIEQIIGAPIEFYLEKPLDEQDMQRITLPPATLVTWLRVNYVERPDGSAGHAVSLDPALASQWLSEIAPTVAREPKNARFYFDDYTGELVLIEPHTNGRYLDVDATLQRLLEQVKTPNRSVPLVMREVVPVVNANATAADLGIVDLVTYATTWFYGSPPERMKNIARAAAQFYGIVLAPGELFSFNKYLGEVSEDMGYERGLIIANGRTIEGVGGGVCQVSTTLFQAAFWGGYDIGARIQHGYRVHYYENDLEGRGGPGMDATIYSPIVDFTFTNNTEHYLLIENYFNQGQQSLTFKFYSTDIGRTVERDVVVQNETPPKPDVYELNASLGAGEYKQVDWAVGGADVIVHRVVYNRWGEVRDEDYFISHYIPWANVYEYGPGSFVPETPAGN